MNQTKPKTIEQILKQFDELEVINNLHPAQYGIITKFFRQELTTLLESLMREEKPFIKGLAYTTENNVNSGYNQRCTEINEDINKILGK